MELGGAWDGASGNFAGGGMGWRIMGRGVTWGAERYNRPGYQRERESHA